MLKFNSMVSRCIGIGLIVECTGAYFSLVTPHRNVLTCFYCAKSHCQQDLIISMVTYLSMGRPSFGTNVCICFVFKCFIQYSLVYYREKTFLLISFCFKAQNDWTFITKLPFCL